MGIQWHISSTSQYGKLYFPWYVMDHHNPCWESTDWALLTWDGDGWCAPPNCTWEMVYRLYHIIQYNGGLNPIPSAFSIRKRPNNGGGITYWKAGKTWETREWNGVANFETTPFELWRTRTGLQKIRQGSVCFVSPQIGSARSQRKPNQRTNTRHVIGSVYTWFKCPRLSTLFSRKCNCVSNSSPFRSS